MNMSISTFVLVVMLSRLGNTSLAFNDAANVYEFSNTNEPFESKGFEKSIEEAEKPLVQSMPVGNIEELEKFGKREIEQLNNSPPLSRKVRCKYPRISWKSRRARKLADARAKSLRHLPASKSTEGKIGNSLGNQKTNARNSPNNFDNSRTTKRENNQEVQEMVMLQPSAEDSLILIGEESKTVNNQAPKNYVCHSFDGNDKSMQTSKEQMNGYRPLQQQKANLRRKGSFPEIATKQSPILKRLTQQYSSSCVPRPGTISEPMKIGIPLNAEQETDDGFYNRQNDEWSSEEKLQNALNNRQMRPNIDQPIGINPDIPSLDSTPYIAQEHIPNPSYPEEPTYQDTLVGNAIIPNSRNLEPLFDDEESIANGHRVITPPKNVEEMEECIRDYGLEHCIPTVNAEIPSYLSNNPPYGASHHDSQFDLQGPATFNQAIQKLQNALNNRQMRPNIDQPIGINPDVPSLDSTPYIAQEHIPNPSYPEEPTYQDTLVGNAIIPNSRNLEPLFDDEESIANGHRVITPPKNVEEMEECIKDYGLEHCIPTVNAEIPSYLSNNPPYGASHHDSQFDLQGPATFNQAIQKLQNALNNRQMRPNIDQPIEINPDVPSLDSTPYIAQEHIPNPSYPEEPTYQDTLVGNAIIPNSRNLEPLFDDEESIANGHRVITPPKNVEEMEECIRDYGLEHCIPTVNAEIPSYLSNNPPYGASHHDSQFDLQGPATFNQAIQKLQNALNNRQMRPNIDQPIEINPDVPSLDSTPYIAQEHIPNPSYPEEPTYQDTLVGNAIIPNSRNLEPLFDDEESIANGHRVITPPKNVEEMEECIRDYGLEHCIPTVNAEIPSYLSNNPPYGASHHDSQLDLQGPATFNQAIQKLQNALNNRQMRPNIDQPIGINPDIPSLDSTPYIAQEHIPNPSYPEEPTYQDTLVGNAIIPNSRNLEPLFDDEESIANGHRVITPPKNVEEMEECIRDYGLEHCIPTVNAEIPSYLSNNPPYGASHHDSQFDLQEPATFNQAIQKLQNALNNRQMRPNIDQPIEINPDVPSLDSTPYIAQEHIPNPSYPEEPTYQDTLVGNAIIPNSRNLEPLFDDEESIANGHRVITPPKNVEEMEECIRDYGLEHCIPTVNAEIPSYLSNNPPYGASHHDSQLDLQGPATFNQAIQKLQNALNNRQMRPNIDQPIGINPDIPSLDSTPYIAQEHIPNPSYPEEPTYQDTLVGNAIIPNSRNLEPLFDDEESIANGHRVITPPKNVEEMEECIRDYGLEHCIPTVNAEIPSYLSNNPPYGASHHDSQFDLQGPATFNQAIQKLQNALNNRQMRPNIDQPIEINPDVPSLDSTPYIAQEHIPNPSYPEEPTYQDTLVGNAIIPNSRNLEPLFDDEESIANGHRVITPPKNVEEMEECIRDYGLEHCIPTVNAEIPSYLSNNPPYGASHHDSQFDLQGPATFNQAIQKLQNALNNRQMRPNIDQPIEINPDVPSLDSTPYIAQEHIPNPSYPEEPTYHDTLVGNAIIPNSRNLEPLFDDEESIANGHRVITPPKNVEEMEECIRDYGLEHCIPTVNAEIPSYLSNNPPYGASHHDSQLDLQGPATFNQAIQKLQNALNNRQMRPNIDQPIGINPDIPSLDSTPYIAQEHIPNPSYPEEPTYQDTLVGNAIIPNSRNLEPLFDDEESIANGHRVITPPKNVEEMEECIRDYGLEHCIPTINAEIPSYLSNNPTYGASHNRNYGPTKIMDIDDPPDEDIESREDSLEWTQTTSIPDVEEDKGRSTTVTGAENQRYNDLLDTQEDITGAINSKDYGSTDDNAPVAANDNYSEELTPSHVDLTTNRTGTVLPANAVSLEDYRENNDSVESSIYSAERNGPSNSEEDYTKSGEVQLTSISKSFAEHIDETANQYEDQSKNQDEISSLEQTDMTVKPNKNPSNNQNGDELTMKDEQIIDTLVGKVENHFKTAAMSESPKKEPTTKRPTTIDEMAVTRRLLLVPEVQHLILQDAKHFGSDVGDLTQFGLSMAHVADESISAVFKNVMDSLSTAIEADLQPVPKVVGESRSNDQQTVSDENLKKYIANLLHHSGVTAEELKSEIAQNILFRTIQHILEKVGLEVNNARVWDTLKTVISETRSPRMNALANSSIKERTSMSHSTDAPDVTYKRLPFIPVREHVFKDGRWIEKSTLLGSGRKQFQPKETYTNSKKIDSEFTAKQTDHGLPIDSEESFPEEMNADYHSPENDKRIINDIADSTEGESLSVSKELKINEEENEKIPIKYYSPTDRILAYRKKIQAPKVIFHLEEKTTASPRAGRLQTLGDSLFPATPTAKKISPAVKNVLKEQSFSMTPEYDPTYFGKITSNSAQSSRGKMSDLANTDLFYIGDGVKIPLKLTKTSDGSWGLSISEKICENLAKQKCPRCVPNDGDIMEEKRRLKKAIIFVYDKNTTPSTIRNNHFLIDEIKSLGSVDETKERRTRSFSNSDVITTSTSPVIEFVQRYNLTLNPKNVLNSSANNEEFSNTIKTWKLPSNAKDINGDNVKKNEYQMNGNEDWNELSKNLNVTEIRELSSKEESNKFAPSLLNINEVPEAENDNRLGDTGDSFMNCSTMGCHYIMEPGLSTNNETSDIKLDHDDSINSKTAQKLSSMEEHQDFNEPKILEMNIVPKAEDAKVTRNPDTISINHQNIPKPRLSKIEHVNEAKNKKDVSRWSWIHDLVNSNVQHSARKHKVIMNSQDIDEAILSKIDDVSKAENAKGTRNHVNGTFNSNSLQDVATKMRYQEPLEPNGVSQIKTIKVRKHPIGNSMNLESSPEISTAIKHEIISEPKFSKMDNTIKAKNVNLIRNFIKGSINSNSGEVLKINDVPASANVIISQNNGLKNSNPVKNRNPKMDRQNISEPKNRKINEISRTKYAEPSVASSIDSSKDYYSIKNGRAKHRDIDRPHHNQKKPNEYDNYDLTRMTNEKAKYDYQKDNSILKRIRSINKKQMNGRPYRYQQYIDDEAQDRMDVMTTVLHWLKEVFFEPTALGDD